MATPQKYFHPRAGLNTTMAARLYGVADVWGIWHTQDYAIWSLQTAIIIQFGLPITYTLK